MRDMKIKVENNLDEIIIELKRLGYECCGYLTSNDTWIIAQDDGNIIGCDFEVDNPYWKPTTLAELKEM